MPSFKRCWGGERLINCIICLFMPSCVKLNNTSSHPAFNIASKKQDQLQEQPLLIIELASEQAGCSQQSRFALAASLYMDLSPVWLSCLDGVL